jgi:ketosteroid isomerase-like protein
MLARNPLMLAAAAILFSAAGTAQEFRPETIIALERGAMDRWGRGDPQGFIELFADEVTYFDPSTERRVDGAEAMRARFAPIKGLVKLSRYEIQNPDVYRRGELAILSYNLVTYGQRADGAPQVVRWNTTEAYAQIGGQWKIVHSHFSLTQPPPATPTAQ